MGINPRESVYFAMPMSKVRQAVSGLDRLAQTIAVPHEHPPMRLPTFPNLERTGVLQFMQTDSITTGSGKEGALVLVRSPTYPLWCKLLPTSSTFYVQTICNVPNSIEVPTAIGAIPLPLLRYSAPSGTPGWVNKFVLGLDSSDRQVVYIPAGVTCAVALLGVYTATNAELDCMFYSAGAASNDISEPVGVTLNSTDGKNFTSVNVTGGFLLPKTVRFTTAPTTAGYISGIAVGYVSGGNLTTPSGSLLDPVLLPLFTPAEFTNSTVPYRSVRCISAAVLASNATRTLEKEGTILAARLSSRSYGFLEGTANRTAVYSAHPKERYYGLLEKGIYAFTLPDAESEKFGDHVAVGYDGGTVLPVMRLDSLGYFSSILLQDLDATSNTTMAITLDYHIEFRTASMLFPLGFSNVSLESYHGAQMALVQLGTFFENPLHMAAITSLVKSAVMKALPVVAPYAIGAAKAVGSLAIDAAIRKFKPQAQAGFVVPRAPRMPLAVRSQPKVKAKGKAKKKKK